MSFTQGLSGLNAASKQLEVIGNNVANASTVGFKQSQAQFADVFAAALTGSGSSQIGIGAKLATVAQQFTQGNISTTNNSLDMAINGPGFFALDTQTGTKAYSRNGQFQLDKTGQIVSSTGHKLQGFLPIPNSVPPTMGSTLQALTVPTGVNSANASTKITAGLNLDSRSAFIPVATAFDPSLPNTYNNSTSTSTYDAQGKAQITTLYFREATGPGSNAWDVYTTVADPNAAAGVYLFPAPPALATAATTKVGQILYNTNGTYSSFNTAAPAVALTFTPPGQLAPPAVVGPSTVQTMALDFSASTQYGATFGVTTLTQDGYTVGQLSGFSISPDGTILGRYSNGTTKAVGQVALVTFPNMQGLQPLGDNLLAETGASGNAVTGAPGAGNNGVLQTSSVEDSNVDLTAELVNMITAQRVYQANAQTIKTQDAVMQTLINLR